MPKKTNTSVIFVKLIIVYRNTEAPSEMFSKILNSPLYPVTTCGKAPSQIFDRALNSPLYPLMISSERFT